MILFSKAVLTNDTALFTIEIIRENDNTRKCDPLINWNCLYPGRFANLERLGSQSSNRFRFFFQDIWYKVREKLSATKKRYLGFAIPVEV